MRAVITRKGHGRLERSQGKRDVRVYRYYRVGDELDVSEGEFDPARMRRLGEGKSETATPEPKDQNIDPHDIVALRERAEALGIHVDGRWGDRRLRQEIADAEA
jgi:hypothetical protein